jgi:hypothetical protein
VPPSRRASPKASTTALIAPTRAAKTQMSGAIEPSGAARVVTITGSGFHDGPLIVFRSPWTISRPQTIHDHAS